jgi:hypothetical protein
MRIRALLATGLLTAGASVLVAAPAAAHDTHQVGDVDVTVGFAEEPAYAGQPNGVQMFLDHGGEPVTDAEGFEVTVTFNDQTSEAMTLEPAFEVGEFGTPGDYRANFVPSRPGTYTFRVTGTYHGEDIDEEFTSGPRTFDDVEDVAAAAFPEVMAPSNDELATRIEQDAARTTDAVASANEAAAAAVDDASAARTIGLVGVALGAAGLVVGLRKRSGS